MDMSLDDFIIKNRQKYKNLALDSAKDKSEILNSSLYNQELEEYEKLCDGPHSFSNPNHCKLFIANVNYSVTAQDLEGLFGYFGKVCRAVVHYDEHGYPLQTAEVIFSNFNDGINARDHYNHSLLDGKLIIIRLMDSSNNTLFNDNASIPESVNWINLKENNNFNTHPRHKKKPFLKNKLIQPQKTFEDLDAELDEYLTQKDMNRE